MPTYKNITDKSLELVGYGIIEPGQTVESEKGINNKNFQEVTTSSKVTVKKEDKPIKEEKKGGKE